MTRAAWSKHCQWTKRHLNTKTSSRIRHYSLPPIWVIPIACVFCCSTVPITSELTSTVSNIYSTFTGRLRYKPTLCFRSVGQKCTHSYAHRNVECFLRLKSHWPSFPSPSICRSKCIVNGHLFGWPTNLWWIVASVALQVLQQIEHIDAALRGRDQKQCWTG